MRQWQKAVDNYAGPPIARKRTGETGCASPAVEMQKREESSIPGKTNSTTLQIESQQSTNANSVVQKHCVQSQHCRCNLNGGKRPALQ